MHNRDLVLHIGHAKTGTTYLQALLTQNAARLADVDVLYPVVESTADNTFIENWKEHHSFGNAISILGQSTQPPAPVGTKTIVLSSEHLFEALVRNHDQAIMMLRRFCEAHDITRVRSFLMVRDPVEHFISAKSQMLGPHPSGPDILDSLLADIRKLLTTQIDLPQHSLTIFNYSRHAHRMKALLAEQIGVGCDVLEEPVQLGANRSLTAPEYLFTKSASQVLGYHTQLVSNALKANVQAPAHGTYRPPIAEQKTYVEDRVTEIDAINAILPQAEQYRIEYYDPAAIAGPYTIEESWFEQAGRAVGYLLDGTLRTMKANQVQVELLTTSRAVLTQDWAEAKAAIDRADQHILEFSLSGPEEQAEEMKKAAQSLRDQIINV